MFDRNVLEIEKLIKDIGDLTPLIHKEQKNFLYDDSNIITNTFFIEFNTEENLKLKIKETLGIENIEFERVHRVGDKNLSSCRTIVVKLSKYKTKEHILTKVRKKKPQGIRIYEDFSKATVQIRKENWKKVKDLRSKGKYAVLVYDKIYTE